MIRKFVSSSLSRTSRYASFRCATRIDEFKNTLENIYLILLIFFFCNRNLKNMMERIVDFLFLGQAAGYFNQAIQF